MKWLFIARDRTQAEVHAYEWFPAAQRVTRDRWKHGDTHIDIAIFGADLCGRQYDRILVAQQKHLPAAYSGYLMFRLKSGGRFERLDPPEDVKRRA